MKQKPSDQIRQPHSRRWTRASGLPYLAAKLPEDFRSPTAVNAFVYSLTAEVIVGRVERRTAAVLGYLTQLAMQSLILLDREARLELEAEKNLPVRVITNIPRPRYADSKQNASVEDGAVTDQESAPQARSVAAPLKTSPDPEATGFVEQAQAAEGAIADSDERDIVGVGIAEYRHAADAPTGDAPTEEQPKGWPGPVRRIPPRLRRFLAH